MSWKSPSGYRIKVTGTLDPNAIGDYLYAGEYNGEDYYYREDGAYFLWHEGGYWYITNHLGWGTGGYWLYGGVGDPVGNYNPAGGATGTATVSVLDWVNVSMVYDENTGTSAYRSILKQSWSSFIELVVLPATLCNKIRFYIDTYTSSYITLVDVDVYYEGGWHNVYNGAFTKGEWNEQSIPDGSFVVSRVRLSFYNNHPLTTIRVYLDEFDFNQIAVRPLVNGSLASGSLLIGKGLAR